MIAIPRPGSRMVIATHNEGKRQELAAFLAPFGIGCVSAGELGLPAPEETAEDFAGNARLKALAAARAAGMAALADDSGLAVAAIGGAPGVHSARFADSCGGYPEAMAAILREVGAERRAAFICALCLATAEGETATWMGITHGILAEVPRGSRGFGYDPLFVPLGESRSYGEMSPDEKSRDSHRARAFRQLAARLAMRG